MVKWWSKSNWNILKVKSQWSILNCSTLNLSTYNANNRKCIYNINDIELYLQIKGYGDVKVKKGAT